MNYKLRFGHAPDILRSSFEELVYEDDIKEVALNTKLWDGDSKDINWLLGHLWNCTDTMPSMLCDSLSMTQGSSYAQGVRFFKEYLKE